MQYYSEVKPIQWSVITQKNYEIKEHNKVMEIRRLQCIKNKKYQRINIKENLYISNLVNEIKQNMHWVRKGKTVHSVLNKTTRFDDFD